MNSELTMPTKLSFKSNKVMVNGDVMRAAIFARFMVAEVQTELTEKYYLIFYKNALIYGDQLDKVEKGSFIDKVLNEGIILDQKHPLLPVFIPVTALVIPAKNKLFNHLQRNYSLLEIPCIAASLDSFFPPEQLAKPIENIFFHYRRNGSFSNAYQSIHLLSGLSPSLEKISDLLHSREYSSYSRFYATSSISEIQKKGPLICRVPLLYESKKHRTYSNARKDIKKRRTVCRMAAALDG